MSWKVVNKLGLSYGTAGELNQIINTLPGQPPFKSWDFTIGGETLTFYFWDIMQCIQALYGNPKFTHELAFVPERHYSDPEHTCHVDSEMHTGDWWWAVQVIITIFPLVQYCGI